MFQSLCFSLSIAHDGECDLEKSTGKLSTKKLALVTSKPPQTTTFLVPILQKCFKTKESLKLWFENNPNLFKNKKGNNVLHKTFMINNFSIDKPGNIVEMVLKTADKNLDSKIDKMEANLLEFPNSSCNALEFLINMADKNFDGSLSREELLEFFGKTKNSKNSTEIFKFSTEITEKPKTPEKDTFVNHNIQTNSQYQIICGIKLKHGEKEGLKWYRFGEKLSDSSIDNIRVSTVRKNDWKMIFFDVSKNFLDYNRFIVLYTSYSIPQWHLFM